MDKDQQPYQCCKNSTYHCRLPVLKDSVYCHQHVLQEKGKTPYKRCEFFYDNRKRCTSAVYKEEGDDDEKVLCDLHKPDSEDESKPPVLSNEDKLIILLTKQLKIEPDNNSKVFKGYEKVIKLEEASVPLDFSKYTEYVRKDEIPNTLNDLSKLDDSETDGDDDDEHCLKHGAVYSETELLRLNIHYMNKLKSLYEEEMGLMVAKMAELDEEHKANKVDKENDLLTEAEKREYRGYCRYIRLMDAKRAKHSGVGQKKPKEGIPSKKCAYRDYAIKCVNECFADSVYCFKHICEDTQQFLFKPCGHKIGKEICKEPILHIEDACIYHTQIIEKKAELDESVNQSFSEYYNLLEEIEANL